MRPRRDTHLAHERADVLWTPAIGPDTVVQDTAPDALLDVRVEGTLDVLGLDRLVVGE